MTVDDKRENDQAQLYCIRRQNALRFETGFYSYVTPKLYLLNDAKRVVNQKNKDLIVSKSYRHNTYEHMRDTWSQEQIDQCIARDAAVRNQQELMGPYVYVPVKVVEMEQ